MCQVIQIENFKTVSTVAFCTCLVTYLLLIFKYKVVQLLAGSCWVGWNGNREIAGPNRTLAASKLGLTLNSSFYPKYS